MPRNIGKIIRNLAQNVHFLRTSGSKPKTSIGLNPCVSRDRGNLPGFDGSALLGFLGTISQSGEKVQKIPPKLRKTAKPYTAQQISKIAAAK